jgi:hypothetical protein
MLAATLVVSVIQAAVAFYLMADRGSRLFFSGVS